MRLSRYILFLLLIFLLERLWNIWLFESPFIFVVFIIIFALNVQDMALWLPAVAVPALFFDLFSGLDYGLMTLALLIVYATIYVAKKSINIDGRSYIAVSLSAFLFLAQYLIVLSLFSPPLFGILLEHIRNIFLSSLIVVFIMVLVFNGVIYPKHS